MNKLWEKLKEFFTKHDPDVLDNLCDPLTSDEQKDLAKHFGAPLPEDLLDCLKIHNGQRSTKHGTLFTNWALLSSTEIINRYEIELDDDGEEVDDGYEFDSGVKNFKFNKRWLPIAGHYHSENYIFIDMDPDHGGSKGQIVLRVSIGDKTAFKIIGKNFKSWFTEMANARIQGRDHKLPSENWLYAEESVKVNGKKAMESFNMSTSISQQSAEQTLATLGNANELVRFVAQEVIGNEVADTINGSPIGRDTIYQLAQAAFMKNLDKYRKG